MVSPPHFWSGLCLPAEKNIHYVSSDSRRKTHYAVPERKEKEDRLAHSERHKTGFRKKKKARARSLIFLNLYPVWENASPQQSVCVNRGREDIGDLDNWTEKGILLAVILRV